MEIIEQALHLLLNLQEILSAYRYLRNGYKTALMSYNFRYSYLFGLLHGNISIFFFNIVDQEIFVANIVCISGGKLHL